MTSAYQQQLKQQLRDAENELAQWRRQGHRADRYRAAWQSARQRAEAYGDGILQHCEDRDTVYGWLRDAQAATAAAAARAEQAEALIAAVRALHQPREFVETWTCTECSRTGHVAPDWPCPTITALNGATSAPALRPPSCPGCLWPVHHGITCQENAAVLNSADQTP